MVRRVLEEVFNIVFVKYYKKILIIPIILTIILSYPLIINKIEKGYFIEKDISIEGGYMIRVNYQEAKNLIDRIKVLCDDCSINIYSSITGNKVLEIILPKKKEIFNKVLNFMKKNGVKEITYSIISGEVGRNLFKTLIFILIFSVLFISLAVYYFFRSLLPTLSIVVSTFLTVIDVLGLLSYLGIKFSIIVLGIILMIFGYSVGSDSVLGVYLFKRGGKIEERIKNAFNIVIKQETTSIIVFIILYFLSSLPEIKIISIVAISGLLFDLINTWLLTAQIQRMIIEKNG